jgi:hypothetical protein
VLFGTRYLNPAANKRTKNSIDDSRSVVLGAGLLIVLAASKRELGAIDGLEIREQSRGAARPTRRGMRLSARFRRCDFSAERSTKVVGTVVPRASQTT